MVMVTLFGSIRAHAEGRAQVEVEAATFKELLDRLVEQYPGMKPQIDRGVSVAVDGLVYKEAWFTPIRPDSEVVLLPYMQGG
jgi:molybdopterin synthase sulfur carrier subunit